LLGFRHTLQFAAVLNFSIGCTAACWGLMRRGKSADIPTFNAPIALSTKKNNIALYWILFLTGFATMAMEVVWTRAYSKVLGPLVYSFALLLTVYLSSTAVGSAFYRIDVKNRIIKSKELLLTLSAISAFFPVVLTDPRIPIDHVVAVLIVVKDHLNSGGIFQEYMPRIDDAVLSGATRSLGQSFRYVKIYELIGNWGYHILASNEPFQELSAEQVLAKMPQKARADFEELLTEKDKDATLLGILKTPFSQEQNVPQVLAKTADNVTLDDDRPLNEYFILRNEFGVGNLLQNGAKNTPVQAPLPD
jgi:hypothetical protein